jgi:uncharacterized membrane protein HdeD (DUF308 family)
MTNVNNRKMIALEMIRHSHTWFAALGVAMIVLGLIALSSTTIATLASVIFFGALILVSGIFQIFHAIGIRHKQIFGWDSLFLNLVLGILSVVAGFIMILQPLVGALSLTLLLAAFFTATGFIRIGLALLSKQAHPVRLAINGVISVILGILIGIQWPGSSLWIIGLFIAVDFILNGWWLLMAAFTARHMLQKYSEEHKA